jgi:glycosyltransferase involved in cell wall biosynthesis
MTPLWLAIPLLVLATLSLGLAVYWTVASVKILQNLRRLPTARDGVGLIAEHPARDPVCVVVPAHNEAARIAELIASLRAQRGVELRVVLALDRCTDGTAEVCRRAIGGDARFELVEIAECPADWAGKVHAVWAGVTRSAGARDAGYLLCSDADCRFEPDAIAASVALLEARGLGLLSLFSTLTSRSWYERLVQPAAAFELARQYPLLRANEPDPAERRPFANGQFLLFTREAYDRIGGHESVKGELLEDIALSRAIARAGLGGGLLLAGGMVRCAMYDTWAAFRRGWKRIYTESANRRAERLVSNGWRLRLVGAGLPAAAVACFALAHFVPTADQPLRAVVQLAPELGLIAWLVGTLLAYLPAGAKWWAAPLHPFGAWATGGLLIQAGRDLKRGMPTSWGGREYARPVR